MKSPLGQKASKRRQY